MTLACWVCGCPSFVVPCRVDATVTFRFDEDGPNATSAVTGSDLRAEYDDPDDDGPTCDACASRLYDDPSLRQADLDALAVRVRKLFGAR